MHISNNVDNGSLNNTVIVLLQYPQLFTAGRITQNILYIHFTDLAHLYRSSGFFLFVIEPRAPTMCEKEEYTLYIPPVA